MAVGIRSLESTSLPRTRFHGHDLHFPASSHELYLRWKVKCLLRKKVPGCIACTMGWYVNRELGWGLKNTGTQMDGDTGHP